MERAILNPGSAHELGAIEEGRRTSGGALLAPSRYLNFGIAAGYRRIDRRGDPGDMSPNEAPVIRTQHHETSLETKLSQPCGFPR